MISELETQHLLKSDRMRQRLLKALNRGQGVAWEAFQQVLANVPDVPSEERDRL
ncbi:MAG: hypothetical protein F6K30_25835 [Cyanothece sp. SIO2G6]|nr:hypothetical protein [Cyanothece sp. SIO2G6]